MRRYEWDPKKAAVNYQKHGITFGEATEVFDDPNAELEQDPYPVEERLRIYGWTQRFPKELIVVFCDRSIEDSEEIYRILHARRITEKEKKNLERLRLRKSSRVYR